MIHEMCSGGRSVRGGSVVLSSPPRHGIFFAGPFGSGREPHGPRSRARDHRDGENGDVPHGPTVPCRVSSRRSEPDRLRVALRLRAVVEFEGTRVEADREEGQVRVGMPRVL